MPDFVSKTDNTDQNEISTGCGMAFLSWLQSLGYSLNKIAPAMVTLGTSATFAQLYAALTSAPQAQAWPQFIAAAKALPKIVNDDPFGKTSARPTKKGGAAKGKGAARSNLRRSRK
jgi:hypothetical protein